MGCFKLKYYTDTEALKESVPNFLRVISTKKCRPEKREDYYPFGMQMPGRKYSSGSYRYGFQGQEKDDELKGDGNSYDYGFRIYNPGIAKFLSVDPLTKDYPWYTPYQFAGNKPIVAIDVDGLEEYYTAEGQLIGKFGDETELRIVYDDYVEATKSLIANPESPEAEVINSVVYNRGSSPALSSPEEVADKWGARVNAISIEENREYSSFIFYIKNVGTDLNEYVFTYTEPKRGGVDNAKNQFTQTKSKRLLSHIHSHGAYMEEYKNNQFSAPYYDQSGVYHEADIGAYKRIGIIAYVTTPNGSLLKYDPFREQTEVVNCSQPSDCNDPGYDENEEVNDDSAPVILNENYD